MKKVVDDARLMIKVCDLYYNQNISQQQIADMLSLSRPTVSRLLSSAREQGIVEIRVSNLETIKHWELERQLKELYHLKDVVIVDSVPQREEVPEDAAARYLENTIKDDDIVGISMGATLYQVVNHIAKPAARRVTFVPLIGGMGQLRMELHSNNLAESLSRKFEGSFVPMQAPARVSSAAVRRKLMKEESIAAAIALGERINTAIVGIGYPSQDSAIKATGYFKEDEIESLIIKKAAGEICMQFYDIEGKTFVGQNDNNVIGMEIEKLRKVPTRIGIAYGTAKLRAIQGAIAGQYINVLVTDFDCARALMEERRR
ncbi:MAG: sugar-binding transcriptional regulator [Lachnospiraceae bacterium]|nr:sugar-binding transcriptional regulator [Lachnospiraceae bacterium]